MEALAAGFTIFVNGATTLLGALFSTTAIVFLVMALGLAWMAFIEIEEMNRQSSKPTTPLH